MLGTALMMIFAFYLQAFHPEIQEPFEVVYVFMFVFVMAFEAIKCLNGK